MPAPSGIETGQLEGVFLQLGQGLAGGTGDDSGIAELAEYVLQYLTVDFGILDDEGLHETLRTNSPLNRARPQSPHSRRKRPKSSLDMGFE